MQRVCVQNYLTIIWGVHWRRWRAAFSICVVIFPIQHTDDRMLCSNSHSSSRHLFFKVCKHYLQLNIRISSIWSDWGRGKKWWAGTEPVGGQPGLCRYQCCAFWVTWGRATELVIHFPFVCDQVIFTVSHTNVIHGERNHLLVHNIYLWII